MDSSPEAFVAFFESPDESVVSQYDDVSSDLPPDEAGTSNKRDRMRNCKLVPSSFQKVATLVPCKNDPDVNAMFQVIVSEIDGERIFKCSQCTSSFSRPYSARRHAQIHLKHLNVTCGFCSIKLTGPLSLAAHVKEKHNGQQQPSTSCRSNNNDTNHPLPTRTSRRSAKSDVMGRTKETSTESEASQPTRAASIESVMIIDPEPEKMSMTPRRPDGKSSKNLAKKSLSEKHVPQVAAKKEKKEAVVVTPEEEVNTTGASSTPLAAPLLKERRSSRIQKRMEIEAIAVDEEKIVPPPMYPTNTEKLKESKAMYRRDYSIVHSASKHKRQPDVAIPTTAPSRKAHSKRISGAEGVTSVSSTIGTIFLTPPTATRRLTDDVEQRSPFPELRSLLEDNSSYYPCFPPMPCAPTTSLLTPLSPTTFDTASWEDMATPPSTPTYLRDSSNNHYPRLLSVYGRRVHQRQPKWSIPRSLGTEWYALIYTIFHPAWLKPKEIGMDEINASSNGKGGAELILPRRMHKQSTMIAKCHIALEETSFPLPPLQPLLPSPCPLVDDGCSDPLSDVLHSLPLLPSDPPSFSPIPTMAQPIYTTACMEKRLQEWSKTDDRTWWEVRTFPSFHGLVKSGASPLVPMTTRSSGTVYSMANTHAVKYGRKLTYVTSTSPIFSVQPQSLSDHRPYMPCTPLSNSHIITPSTTNDYTSPTIYRPTPMTAASAYGMERSRRSMSYGEMRQPAPTPLLTLSAPPERKRPAAQPVQWDPEMPSLSKRMRPSILRRGADRPQVEQQSSSNPVYHEMQPVQPVLHEMQPARIYYTNEATQSTSYCSDYDGSFGRDDVAVDYNGTTFTIL